eukprot:111846_1
MAEQKQPEQAKQSCYKFGPYKTGDLVENANIPIPIPKDFTIMGFVCPSEQQTDTMLASRDECGVSANQFRFGVYNNYIGFLATGGPIRGKGIKAPAAYGNGWKTSLTSTKPLKVNKVTHVALVVTQLKCSLYLDGVLNKEAVNVSAADGVTSGITHNSKVTFRIGSRHNGKNDTKIRDSFKGNLTQFVFYDYPLTAKQIKPIVQQGI